MIKQEGPDEQTQGHERSAKKQRWTGNCPLHLNARQARMFDKALVLMGRGKSCGRFPPWKCWARYWKNKLAVPPVNKACWLRVLYGPVHCVQWKVSSPFPSCTWPEHKMYPVISGERCWNAHSNAPRRVCWHPWSGPSDVDKAIPLGFSRFMRGILSFNIISIEIGVPWCTRQHVTLHSSSTHRPPVCAAISHFLMSSTLYHEIFSSCWLWGPFTEKLPAISTIVSTQQTFPGKLLQNKKLINRQKDLSERLNLQTIADAFHQDSI